MVYTDITYQDWVEQGMVDAEPEQKGAVIRHIVDSYKCSVSFTMALDANQYFAGASPVIGKKTMLRGKVITVEATDGTKHSRVENEEIIGNRVSSNFFYHFVTQQNQYLLGNGVSLEDDDMKDRLGPGFDSAIQQIGEKAICHGVGWGFWNLDHLQPISAAEDRNSGFVALLDEMTGVPMVGIRFWQVADNKPLCVWLFETDGITGYRENEDGVLVIPDGQQKRAYSSIVFRDGAGEMTVATSNYSALPVIPFYANSERNSELTPSIRSKIDLYDRILSDFGDNLDRANDVYWVLNNFSGDVNTISSMFEYINKLKAVINETDGMNGGATAEPRTIEVPYAARQTALDLLRKALYQDYMALDMESLTGGSLTNVAIKAAYSSMDLKASRYEWQAFNFVQQVLRLVGVETQEIRFHRQSIINESEVISAIYQMRQDIDLETALKLNPLIMQEEIPNIIQNVQTEGQTGMPSVDELQKFMDQQGMQKPPEEPPEEDDEE